MKAPPWMTLESACNVGIAATLAISAALKWLGGRAPGAWLSPAAHYGVLVLECLLLVAMITRFRRLAVLVVFVCAIGGSIVVWSDLVPRNCGCLGVWRLEKREHLVLLAFVGVLASGSLRTGCRSQASPG